MGQTFTLEEIKAAFWKHFKGAGELWFPAVDDSDAEQAVCDQWEQFTEALKQPVSGSSSSTEV
jgi:hypothetical protein